MNVIMALCFTAIFIVVIRKHRFFKDSGLSFQILIGIFSLKLLSAIALHLLYSIYYTERSEADIFKYFDDALVLFQSFKDSPALFFKLFFSVDIQNAALTPYYDAMNFWERKIDYGIFNDNRTIIRLNAILMFVSWGNIFVHHCIASFVSLIACICLYKVFRYYFPTQHVLIAIGIFLIPSSLFWTSALLKETVVMLGLGLTMYGLHRDLHKSHTHAFIILLLGIVVLSTVKLYVVAAFVPAIAAYILSRKFDTIPSLVVFAGIFIVSIAAVVVNHILGFVPFLETLASKRNDFIMDAAYYAHAQSYIEIGMIRPTLAAFVSETPIALLRAFQLPIIFYIQKPLELMPALENLVCIVLIICMAFWFKKPDKKQRAIIWFSLFFSIGLLWFVGVSTPVVGAIVRYKMPLLPFLYTSLALCIDWKKITDLLLRRKAYGSSII